MKKLICLIGLLPLSLFAQKQTLEVDATLGAGYARYAEEGSIRPVESDWSGWTSSFSIGAKAVGMTLEPYFRLGILGSELAEETWKENGQIVQQNDMYFGGLDLMTGVDWPLHPSWGTVTPSLGVLARYHAYTRDDFVFYSPGLIVVDRSIPEIEETVEMLGVGAGIQFEFPMGEAWEMAMGTRAHWLFYTHAENDAFASDIGGQDGWIWQSSLSFVKKLRKPGQAMGLRFVADFQSIRGDVTDNGNSLQEWPDNDWQNLSAELYWRGAF
jgi:hypothetical protein